MVHSRPQKPQGESVAKPETFLLIILSIVCQYYRKEVHGNSSNPFLKKKVRGRNDPREVDICRKSSPYIRHFILLSKWWHHPVQGNQCPEMAGHHRASLSPYQPMQIKHVAHPISHTFKSKLYIYIYIQTYTYMYIYMQFVWVCKLIHRSSGGNTLPIPWWIHVICISISFRASSLAMGYSFDHPNACDVTLKDMRNLNRRQATATKYVYSKTKIVCTITAKPVYNDHL